jgi:DNA-binding NtrC family response regulator
MKRLLIIDPDPRSRAALRTIFAPDYALDIATDAGQAAPFLAEHVDLLIYGCSNAREYFEAQRPRFPALVLSVSPISVPGFEVLAKPFDVAAIRRKVAELIAGDPQLPIIGMPGLEQPVNLEEAVSNFERGLIIQALEKCNGIQTRAASQLGTTRRILRYRMDKLGIGLPVKKTVLTQPCQSPSAE